MDLAAVHRVLQRPADPQPPGVAARIPEKRLAGRQRRQGVHVAGPVARHDVEQQRRVRDRARQRAVDAEPGQVRDERRV
jgi:hypothetical protein